MFSKKSFRYIYWFVQEFFKKNLKLILLSSLLSFIFIVVFISVTPYITTLFFGKKDVIGIVGKYDYSNLPTDIKIKISNGLVSINNEGVITPALASYWEVLDNGLRYRFHLKQNLLWGNGKKFTAYDIHYSFKDVQTSVADSNTIYFTLKKPLPIFVTYLTTPIISYPTNGVAGLYTTDYSRQKFGYITEISLSPNKNGLNPVVYKFFNTESEMVNAYKTGDINQMTVSKKSIADVFSSWKNTTVTRDVDYSSLLTLYFNLNKNIFKEKDIRKAFISAIDNQIFNDEGVSATGPIPPISWAHDPLLKPSIYDPETAEKILKKNFTGTESASLNLYTYYDYLDQADLLLSEFKKEGLNINLNILNYEKPADFDLFLAFWKVPVDPDQYFFWHSTQTSGNISNYKNVRVDKLLEDGRNTTSLSERKQIYLDFQKTLIDDPPAIFLYYPYIYKIQRK